MPRWFPLSGSSVVHFYQAGDSQAEERFELNTKAGAEERRGAEGSSKVEEDDDENLPNICRGTFTDFQTIPLFSHSVTNTFEFATGSCFRP